MPYNEIQTKEALKKIESLIILAKQKMPANKIVLSELENLSEKTKDYCKNTLDLFNHFYTYAAIAKQDANQFNNKAAMGYYYAYKYSYLLDLLNKFLDDPTYRSQFEDNGMMATGVNPDNGLVEVVEVPSHRYFVGVQFHPESVLTEHGHLMLANWLTQCGDIDALAKSVGLSPVVGKRA